VAAGILERKGVQVDNIRGLGQPRRLRPSPPNFYLLMCGTDRPDRRHGEANDLLLKFVAAAGGVDRILRVPRALAACRSGAAISGWRGVANQKCAGRASFCCVIPN
jgi:hypothetical protein